MGHEEDEKPRMVKSPWFEEEIPFDLAAETGTRKVIRDHSTIGLSPPASGPPRAGSVLRGTLGVGRAAFHHPGDLPLWKRAGCRHLPPGGA